MKAPPPLVFLCLFCHWIGLSSGQQQYFRVHPTDISVGEGGTATVSCVVENRAGRVQWTKDGLTLGYSRSIPGNPRYTVLGNDDNGEFSLQIADVRLEDDADYECQVGPANYNRPIRHRAHLHVLLKPTSIEIVGHPTGSRVKIKENEEVELTCKVANAKPKADIVWYRKDSQFVTDSREDSEEDGSLEGRKTVTSTIKFRPTARDNSATYACEAQHPALHSETMRVSVVLSVMYPPGPPEIQGYIQGETIRMGQTVSLTCVSYGGNPLATITWFRNGEMVDMSYTTSGRESRNMHTFVAAASDNNAKFSCEARNEMSVETMKAEIKMAVHFAPEKVTIEGPSEAKVGDSLSFKCATANSNPPASVQWVVDGRTVHAAFTHSGSSDEGGWVTTSELAVSVSPNDRNKMISCYAVNQELGETIQQTHMVSILYPPGAPNITGLTTGTPLIEGQIRRLTCMSMAGNPLADLKWFMGDTELTNAVTVKGENGDYSKSDLTITADRKDNGKEYVCKASNPATAEPLKASLPVSVLFKPDKVKISMDPAEPKAGQKAILTCESGTSNPTARILWRYKNKQHAGVDTNVKSGDFGGNITTNMLEIEVKPEDHGAVIICEAVNDELQESVHNAETLSVKYKPRFQEESDVLKVFSVNEGGNLIINLPATANPPEIEYKWTKSGNGGSRIPTSDEALPESRAIALPGGSLNISQARREDTGIYKVKASNSEGKTTFKFRLDVHYAPKINQITSHVLVYPGENAEMVCVVDANPINADTVKWLRDDFDMDAKAKMVSVSNTSFFLTIINVTEADAGKFTCEVNNGIGEAVSNSSYLLVRHKPKIDKSPALAKSASDKGQIGKLVCRAQGAPDISFMWSRQGRVIQINKVDEPSEGDEAAAAAANEGEDIKKYEVKNQMIDRLTWQSELLVKNVTSNDYGIYDCIAQNEMGLERYPIYLNVTSRPDPPSYLRILNVTYNSVNITWMPGFDGGFAQTFKIRYQREGADNYQYVDVTPEGTNTFEVQDLKVDTKYSFSIVAFNSIGASSYTSPVIVGTKNPQSPLLSPNEPASTSAEVVVGVAVAVTVLVLFNALLLFCIVKRKSCCSSPRRSSSASSSTSGKTSSLNEACCDTKAITTSSSEGGSSTASTKSATIEMYVGSSTGYNDTMSGETMSSISEKSGSYISDGHHVDRGHHAVHRHHVHRHQPSPHLLQATTEFDMDEEEEEEEEEEDLRTTQKTYLVDHHPQMFDVSARPSYATMPRQQLTSTFIGHEGGPRQSMLPQNSHRHYDGEELRRQAYIQSLGVNPVDSSFPSRHDSVDVDVIYGGVGEMYNGLYVPPADPEEVMRSRKRISPADNYGYMPSPAPPMRPPPPAMYPENAGHLV